MHGGDGFGRGRTHGMMPGKMLNSRSSVLGLNMNPDSQMSLTLSQTDIELLDKESNKCKKEETMEYPSPPYCTRAHQALDYFYKSMSYFEGLFARLP